MNENKTNINWFPGHMAKTKREIREKLDLIDIVYEVIDARMPISSKIVDIDDLVKDKPRVLVVTKYDLCDKSETDKIIEKYKNAISTQENDNYSKSIARLIDDIKVDISDSVELDLSQSEVLKKISSKILSFFS